MTVSRGQNAAPVLPQEVVSVTALGGDVIVRGLLMSQRMAMSAQLMLDSKPVGDETEEQGRVRAKSRELPKILAHCVFLDDGKPLFTQDEWDVWGSKHPDEAMELFNVARRLNGEDVEDVAKN